MFSFFHHSLISLLLIFLTIHPTFQTNQCPGRCYSTADSSAQGYYCSTCPAGCASCTSATFCSWCLDGWYGSGSLCTQGNTLVCPTGCSACNAQKECFLCQSNYKLSGTTCVQTCPTKTFFQDTPTSQPCQIPECIDCPSHCSTCENASECKVCDSGYDLVGTTCYVQCGAGEYNVDADNCDNCPSHCSSCQNASQCKVCYSGYDLIGTNCYVQCGTGYYNLDTETCDNCPNHCSICENSSQCKVCDSGYDLIGTTCYVQCGTGYYNSDANTCSACPAECSACSSSTTCTACINSYNLNSGVCSKTTKEADVASKSKLVSSSVTQVANLFASGKSIMMSANLCGKILSNIRYLDVVYSTELQDLFNTWTTSIISFGFDFDMPDGLESKMPSRYVPFVFSRYDIPSSFLENFWNNIYVLSGAVLLFIALRITEYIYERTVPKKSSVKTMVKASRLYIQNILLTLLYGIYGDVVMFAIIEYRSIKFEWSLAMLSFAVSIFFFILMTINFGYHFHLISKYQSLKKQNRTAQLEDFTQNHKGTQVLFKDFNDKNIWIQSFLLLLTLRDLAFSLILASLYEYPLAQIILILILNAAMFVCLITGKPFKECFDLFQQAFFEISGLTVNISVLVNFLLSKTYEEMLTSRVNIGKGIIVTNIVFNFVTVGFMLYNLIMFVKELYSDYKRKKAEKNSVQTLSTVIALRRRQQQASQPDHNTSIARLNNNNSTINIQDESVMFNTERQGRSSDFLPLSQIPQAKGTFRNPTQKRVLHNTPSIRRVVPVVSLEQHPSETISLNTVQRYQPIQRDYPLNQGVQIQRNNHPNQMNQAIQIQRQSQQQFMGNIRPGRGIYNDAHMSYLRENGMLNSVNSTAGMKKKIYRPRKANEKMNSQGPSILKIPNRSTDFKMGNL